MNCVILSLKILLHNLRISIQDDRMGVYRGVAMFRDKRMEVVGGGFYAKSRKECANRIAKCVSGEAVLCLEKRFLWMVALGRRPWGVES